MARASRFLTGLVESLGISLAGVGGDEPKSLHARMLAATRNGPRLAGAVSRGRGGAVPLHPCPEGQRRDAAAGGRGRRAISGVLAAVVALSDPELIVIGGSWGAHPLILDAITTAFTRLPRHVAIRAAKRGAESPLAGVRTDALNRLRRAIVAAAH